MQNTVAPENLTDANGREKCGIFTGRAAILATVLAPTIGLFVQN